MFSLIKELNLSLQGRDSNILRSHDKMTAFKKKLGLWKTRINTSLDMFPTLSDYIDNNPSINADMIICDIGKHLDALSQHFDEYFSQICQFAEPSFVNDERCKFSVVFCQKQ